MTNTKDLAPLTFRKELPEKMVTDYCFSKATNSLKKKLPEWDIPRRDPDLILAANKRYLFNVDQRLKEKKKEALKKRQTMNNQWKDLEDKEKGLRENFMKFNKFVKENQEKRERAERKIAEESALIVKRDDDIEKLEKEYSYMLHIRSEMEHNIRNHKRYEEFLLSVVKFHPTFRTVDDIIDRYEALAEARTQLAERHKSDLYELEKARNEMLKITEEKTLAIMGLNYIMAELQSRYEIAKNKALQWETMVTKIKDISVMKLAEIHQVRTSAWNIYLQMCQRKEVEPELTKDDIENQLLFIKRTLFELKKIAKISKRRATKENVLAAAIAAKH